MITQRKPTDNDIVEKIQEMFLVIQSIDVKWTTPEIMSNFLKNHISYVDENIEKQIDTIVNLTSNFLIDNGLVEKGIIDNKYMPDQIGKPGYKMCADFSKFRLKYENEQVIKIDIPEIKDWCEGCNHSIQLEDTSEDEYEQE